MVVASPFEISHISRRPALASGQFHVPAPLDHVAIARCPSGQVASIPEQGNPIFFHSEQELETGGKGVLIWEAIGRDSTLETTT